MKKCLLHRVLNSVRGRPGPGDPRGAPGGSTADRWPLTPGQRDPEAAGPSHLPDRKDMSHGSHVWTSQDTRTALKYKVP